MYPHLLKLKVASAWLQFEILTTSVPSSSAYKLKLTKIKKIIGVASACVPLKSNQQVYPHLLNLKVASAWLQFEILTTSVPSSSLYY